MNIVQLTYVPAGADSAKVATLGEVQRFYEYYTFTDKHLAIQLNNNDATSEGFASDDLLAELMNATIVEIKTLGELTAEGKPTLEAVLNDYNRVHDLRKEYNLETGNINLIFSFRRALIENSELIPNP